MKQSYHFPGQLLERIGKSWSELIAQYDYEVVKAGEPTSHRIVAKKQKRYPHQDFLVFKEENLFVGYDPITEKLCTAMYLDGKWGYKNRAYNAKEHYGK